MRRGGYLTLKSIDLPRKVVVGNKILDRIGDICRKLGLSKSALLLTGPQTLHVAGEEVLSSLANSGFDVTLQIVEESSMSYVKGAQRKIKEVNPRFVVGVGGGKVIDVAKLSSAYEDIPFLSVPTAASHDGISSTHASIKGLKGSISIKAQAPLAIIADTSVIAKSPYRLTASGCGDVIAKLTAVRDWELAHHVRGEYYGDYAANLALMSAELVMKNAKLIREGAEEGLGVLLEALISCGVAMSIAGSSRPCSGSEHLFSHALDIIAPKPALHGGRCGVGTIMMAYLHEIDWRRVREALKEIGAPTSSEELGVEDDKIVEALIIAHKIRPDRYTILSEKKLSKEEATRLAEVTEVI